MSQALSTLAEHSDSSLGLSFLRARVCVRVRVEEKERFITSYEGWTFNVRVSYQVRGHLS